MGRLMDDEAVEAEIARLQNSPLVKLAKKEERIRYRRRQYMYTLRMYEKKGKQLEAAGVTMESLETFFPCHAGVKITLLRRFVMPISAVGPIQAFALLKARSRNVS